MALAVTLIALSLSLSCICLTNAASTPVKPNSYGAIVNVHVEGIYHVCGGTILTRDWILTAAHCVMGLKYEEIELWIGDHLLATGDPFEYKVYVKQIIFHPKYDEAKKLHDIAVINVVPPLEFSDKVTCANTPYCNDTGYENLEGLVVGWSRWDFENGTKTNELMEGAVKIISHEECKKKVPQIPKPKYVICAEGDLCAGDTGGPLFFKEPYYVEQIGVASYTHGGCEKGVTVFAKLSAYAGWLHRKTSGCGDIPFL